MNRMSKFCRLHIFAILMLCCFFAGTANALVCGEAEACDTSTHKCLACKKKAPLTLKLTLWASGTTFTCVPKDLEVPKKCEVTTSGGRTGDTKIKLFGLITIRTIQGDQCIVSNFAEKYSKCYACEVIRTLASVFISVAGQAYTVSRDAANVILWVAAVLWLAGFGLKNVSSFAAIEPMKMLQDLFVQLFKIILAFVIINSGLQTILHYSLEPIMNAGTDFASAITMSVQDYTPEPALTVDEEG